MAKIAVAPLVGAWIEIGTGCLAGDRLPVAPLVGAWIEILGSNAGAMGIRSLPSWERGLKSNTDPLINGNPLSLPSWERGLKLLNFSLPLNCMVAPLVGAWIEILIGYLFSCS